MSDLDFASLLHVHLGWGRDHAKTIGDLAESLNVPRRTVEKGVEELRLRGVPICSGTPGVWITHDPAELLAQVEALRRRAIHQLIGARALRTTARRFARTQQLDLWGAA